MSTTCYLQNTYTLDQIETIKTIVILVVYFVKKQDKNLFTESHGIKGFQFFSKELTSIVFFLSEKIYQCTIEVLYNVSF